MGTNVKGIIAIIPAAGFSTRLGLPKQSVTFEGQPLVVRQAELCQSLGLTTHVVGNQPLPFDGLNSNTHYHFNADATAGMGRSIAFAVNEIPKPQTGYLVLLCDQWGIQANDLKSFIANWNSIDIVISKDKHHQGPPALFPSRMREPLARLTGDQGAKPLLAKHTFKTYPFPGAALDLDTPEDLITLTQSDKNKRAS